MECVDQDPIEVILVFDENDHGQHYSKSGNNRRMDTAPPPPPPPVNLPPQLTGSLGQNYMGKFWMLSNSVKWSYTCLFICQIYIYTDKSKADINQGYNSMPCILNILCNSTLDVVHTIAIVILL